LPFLCFISKDSHLLVSLYHYSYLYILYLIYLFRIFGHKLSRSQVNSDQGNLTTLTLTLSTNPKFNSNLNFNPCPNLNLTLTLTLDDCQLVVTTGRRQLRSSYNFKCTITGTSSHLGDGAFAAAGPRLWNSLPTHVRQLDLSLDTFRHKLKTYLTVRGTAPSNSCF